MSKAQAKPLSRPCALRCGCTGLTMTTYTYRWGNNTKRLKLKGRRCRVVCRGRLNSALIEFMDTGQREVVSRNALRR